MPRAAGIALAVLVWAVTAAGASAYLFLDDSRRVVVATHDAVVRPTLGSHATVRTGPVLPDLRVELDGGGPVGVEVQLGKARAESLRQLLQRYAVIASQPDGQVAKVRDAMEDMARDAALRGAVVGLVPLLLWWLPGAARRRQLLGRLRTRTGVAALAVLAVGATGSVLVLRPWTGPDESVTEPVAWLPLDAFLGVPVPPELEAVRVRGDVLTRESRRLVESALNTYDKSKVFYDRAAAEAAQLDLRTPEQDETVVLFVSDRHDNVGMDRVARAVADRAGATAVFDGGDDTSTGEPWEAFSLDSVTEAFEDLPRWSVTGNHDHGEFVGDYLADRGWSRPAGEVVDGPGETTILGADDPRASGLGSWRDETGLSFAEVAGRLADTACEQDEPVTTILVHDTDLGREAVERGCARLVIGGHTHVARGPTLVEGPDGFTGHEFTTGTAGGAAYAIAMGSKPRRPAVVSLLTYRDDRPLGVQVVTLQTDGGWQVDEWAPLAPRGPFRPER